MHSLACTILYEPKDHYQGGVARYGIYKKKKVFSSQDNTQDGNKTSRHPKYLL